MSPKYNLPVIIDGSSASGYLTDSFEGIDRVFTDVQIVSTSATNVVAKAKRYGRWWMLKALQPEVREQSAFQLRLRKEMEILMQLQHKHKLEQAINLSLLE